MRNKKIIAITGGSGFIGKSLAERHLQLGDTVRILTRGTYTLNEAAIYYRTNLASPDEKVLRAFVGGADVIYHCAGEVYNETLMKNVHIDGTKNLLEIAQYSKARWVQLSSVGAYGPFQAGTCSIASPEKPVSTYERTKTLSDRIVKKSGLPYVILRPSTVFGEAMPNQSMRQMALMIKRGIFFYVGRGAIMNYVHVDDVVRALIICGLSPKACSKTYIISDQISLEEMVRSLSAGLGVSVPKLRVPKLPISLLVGLFGSFPGVPLSEQRLSALTNRCIYDSSQIKSELGFVFERTLQDALISYAQSIK